MPEHERGGSAFIEAVERRPAATASKRMKRADAPQLRARKDEPVKGGHMTKPRQALRADELVAGAHGLVHTSEGVRGPITRITRPFPHYPGSKLEIHVVGGQSMRARPWALFYLPDDDEGEKEVEATVVEAPPLPVEASPLPVEVEVSLNRDPVRGGGPGDEVETPLLPVGSR